MTCWRSLKPVTKGNSIGNTRTRYAARTGAPAWPTDTANEATTVIAGRDPQMERAIAVVIEELQKHRLQQRVVRIVFRPADYPSDEECKLRSAGAQQSSSRRSASVATSAASAQGL